MTARHYVTVRSGARQGFLAGPFRTPMEAVALVARCQEDAGTIDPFAWGFSYLCSTLDGDNVYPLGRLNERLGLIEDSDGFFRTGVALVKE